MFVRRMMSGVSIMLMNFVCGMMDSVYDVVVMV